MRTTTARHIGNNCAVADLVPVVVPALSALAGVVITQSWNDRQNRARTREERARAADAERRNALLRLVVAINEAMDFTRSLFLKGLDGDEIRRINREDEALWSQMFERYLEILIVFPPEASAVAWDHIQRVYAWRDRSIEQLRESMPSPEHQDIVEALRPWLSLADDPRGDTAPGRRPISRKRRRLRPRPARST